jgi:hypothetical protein
MSVKSISPALDLKWTSWPLRKTIGEAHFCDSAHIECVDKAGDPFSNVFPALHDAVVATTGSSTARQPSGRVDRQAREALRRQTALWMIIVAELRALGECYPAGAGAAPARKFSSAARE